MCSHEHVISLRTELFLITLSNGHKNYLLEEIELKVKLLDKLNILIPYSIFIYGLHVEKTLNLARYLGDAAS